ncbi:MAG TPA: MliC family protein [Candidatus Portnoybacteria bacterium]|nr:MliC family protein [Candidatus Portnoybacteria bacterium]
MKIQWNQITWYSKLTAVVVFLIVFALGFWLGYQYYQVREASQNVKPEIINKATFNCEEGKNIFSVFYSDFVSLSLSDGRRLDLGRVMSGSGARYANNDESIIFWNKGDTAFIEEIGNQTFKNCLVSE